MSPINVLVIFSSRTGGTERLALAAAVGAVQARANIRLRRLPDDCAESGKDLTRMRREYVAPTQADTLWADAIIIGVNGKIGGGVNNPIDATAYGRSVALSLRGLCTTESAPSMTAVNRRRRRRSADR